MTRQGLPAAITLAGMSLVTTDNRVLADRHPGQDAHPIAEPDVIAYVDGLGVHLVVRPFHRVFGVVGTVQPDLGADVNEVADRDLVAI